MQVTNTPIYQSEQIRELERLAQVHFDLTEHEMMQRAGKAAFEFMQRRWLNVQNIAVFCGSGNNGGDGYVLARLAQEQNLHVKIWQVGCHDKLKGEARNAWMACREAHIPMELLTANSEINHPDVMVDAICGTGLKGNLREDVIAAIEHIKRAERPIFSLDVPTGIDADTGQVLGAALYATATLTFIGLKLGLLTGMGIAYTGELVVNDLQFPTDLVAGVKPVAEKIAGHAYADYLKPRPRDWHKGLSGRVLIVGGDLGFSGAPRMAAEAALRVGAGLVTVATHPQNAPFMNVTCPEMMCRGITTAEELDLLLSKADVVVIGPGLGQSDWAKQLFERVCESELALVVDADGLNLLANRGKFYKNWVLTPHPGEAARLLDCTVPTIQQDRLSAMQEINQRYGGVTVLKGAGSMVLATHSLPALCDRGNPGMASAGMGDVLSGVIGGLIAQGIPLGDAAKLGVFMHAVAGDMAAKEGERGIIATDLMPYLHKLSNLMGSM